MLEVFQASFNKNRVLANSSELSWSTIGCGIIPLIPPPRSGLPALLLILYPRPGMTRIRSPKPPVDHPDLPVADGENPVPILLDIYII
jgi:hypothetical protein